MIKCRNLLQNKIKIHIICSSTITPDWAKIWIKLQLKMLLTNLYRIKTQRTFKIN